jgi:hypothetical protein
MPVDVVLDSAVILGAISEMGPGAVTFPTVPPRTTAVYADALGVFSYSGDAHFSLILSTEVIEEVVRSVASRADLAWVFDETDPAMERVSRLAHQSGGGYVTPARGIAVPFKIATSTRTALRAAASKELGDLRFVVTEDKVALAIEELQPRGIPWPKNQPISFISPRRLALMADRVRWGMRRI